MNDAAAVRRTRGGVGSLRPPYVATTIGSFSLVFLAAFEALAVTTVMPDVSRELEGVHLYALSFAAPLATSIIGMVLTGAWSDRRGPVPPLLLSIALFSVGLLICGLAPSMEVLVVGRILQGIGGGGLTVGLYVVVAKVYPPRMQPAVLAGFAAAWVLPSLFGPAIAALVAKHFGWEWVFLGTVWLVAGALLLLAPALRELWSKRPTETSSSVPLTPLVWASIAAAAVLALQLLEDVGPGPLLGIAAGAVVLLAVRPLLPRRTLLLDRGLPSVIATRGAVAAAFFCTEAHLPFVLQEQWGFSTMNAGYALALAGVVWALASQAQARLVDRINNAQMLVIGSSILVAGTTGACLAVVLDLPAAALIASYGFASVGMGLGYSRLTFAMMRASSESERGFNSSAISIADALTAALALSVAGVLFAAVNHSHRFDVVFVLATALAAFAVVCAVRSRSPEIG